jgi:hypothetical protein
MATQEKEDPNIVNSYHTVREWTSCATLTVKFESY